MTDPVVIAVDNLVERLRARVFANPAEDQRLRLVAQEAADRIESLTRELAEARGKALEEAAETKPPRSAGSPPEDEWGGWYQVGWDHAVIAYERAIRSLIDKGGG